MTEHQNHDESNTHLHPQQFQGFGLEKQQQYKQAEQCISWRSWLYKHNITQTDRHSRSHESRHILWYGKSLTFPSMVFIQTEQKCRAVAI